MPLSEIAHVTTENILKHETEFTMNSSTPQPFIKWFADITIGDIPLVGGKNASLGEMVRELTGKGVKVPDGFAITAEAYRRFLREARLDERCGRSWATRCSERSATHRFRCFMRSEVHNLSPCLLQ